MRMRVLTRTSKGKLLAIADEVTKLISADKATDTIMPAYPCDGERLVIIIATAKASMPEHFCRFVRSLKRSYAANIAFIIDGTPENAAKIVEMAKTNDAKVHDDRILYLEGGLPFKFLKSVKPEELETVREWTNDLLANLK